MAAEPFTIERFVRELGALLDELAATEPLLLILEDLQWADAATIECLRVIGRRHARARLVVVATFCAVGELAGQRRVGPRRARCSGGTLVHGLVAEALV